MADGYMTALASAPGGYKSHSDDKVRLERVYYKLKRHNGFLAKNDGYPRRGRLATGGRTRGSTSGQAPPCT